MSITIDVNFPGGKKVDAHLKGFTVHTDQPVASRGGGTAPSPFEMFFASLATCAGYYALEFCQSREIKTDGLMIKLTAEKNEAKKLLDKIKIFLTLPEGFPEKYRHAIVRAVDLCTVKRHVQADLNFSIEITD